ncbi:kinase-like protein [Auricularia subglabra TFB-10046 SS5]|nr:kinase-like protein [Auricularia subglabra TFB-10046 SS5]
MSDGIIHEPLRPLSFNLDPQFAELRADLESELHRVHMRLSELRLPPAKRTLGQRLQLMYTSMRVLFLKGSLCAEALEPLSHLLNEFQQLLDNRGSFFGDLSSLSTRLDNIAAQIDIGLCTLSPRTMVSQWPDMQEDARLALKEPLVLPRTQVSPYNTFQGLHDIFPVIITAYPREFRELYDLARALTYLHTEGIVYGDLHAMNVLMGDDGVPVLNFTLAIHESSELSSDFRAWRQRTSVPCARYLAPELIANDSMIPTMQTDIFALGCVAYELFSGRHPFEEVLSDTVAEARILRGQRPTPERRLRSCGEGAGLMRRLIANAWAQDPRQRPTAVAFAETVKEALQRRGQRDAADSKSLPPIPPDDARSNASSTYEDADAQHEERDEAKKDITLELAPNGDDGSPTVQGFSRGSVADVVHHLLHASFAALSGPIDGDNERRFLVCFSTKATWTISGCPSFSRQLRSYGGPHPANVTPRALLRHARLPSVLFEFHLVSSLLPFAEPAEGQTFTATVKWTAWRLVEQGQIKGRSRMVWMDSAQAPDCSTYSKVAEGLAFDNVVFREREGGFCIDHRTFAIQSVEQPAFFAPTSILPEKTSFYALLYKGAMIFNTRNEQALESNQIKHEQQTHD